MVSFIDMRKDTSVPCMKLFVFFSFCQLRKSFSEIAVHFVSKLSSRILSFEICDRANGPFCVRERVGMPLAYFEICNFSGGRGEKRTRGPVFVCALPARKSWRQRKIFAPTDENVA